MGWFGARRRRYGIAPKINEALQRHKLQTLPNWQNNYIDSYIYFALEGSAPSAEADPHAAKSKSEPPSSQAPEVSTNASDPTYRIRRLGSAILRPISVSPNMSVTEAITIMILNDYSQLPVMNGDREVKGIISWGSLGSRLSLGVECREVQDCMEDPHIISADTSLFDAINEIVKHQYVLIRDSDNKISGIVTTSDLSMEFRKLSEPFLLLGEIELHVRRLIDKASFTKEELRAAGDPDDSGRKINSAADMTFGGYISLLERPDSWSKLNIPIDRAKFIDNLDKIREIRNDIMHFDTDEIPREDLESLQKFAAALQKLGTIL